MGHGIVLKGIVKYYGRGKNIPHTFGHTALFETCTPTVRHHGLAHGCRRLFEGYSKVLSSIRVFILSF
jgi:hypothetical protein